MGTRARRHTGLVQRGEREAERTCLFVCTANISRSPYAERRASRLAPSAGIRWASAGIPGLAGHAMDPMMAEQLAARGGSGLGHTSRELTAELVSGADLILTAAFAHELAIEAAWPTVGAGKIVTLGRFAAAVRGSAPGADLPDLLAAASALPGGMAWDVADPYGRGARVARRCAEEIDAHLAAIVPALTGRPAPAQPAPPARRRWRR